MVGSGFNGHAGVADGAPSRRPVDPCCCGALASSPSIQSRIRGTERHDARGVQRPGGGERLSVIDRHTSARSHLGAVRWDSPAALRSIGSSVAIVHPSIRLAIVCSGTVFMRCPRALATPGGTPLGFSAVWGPPADLAEGGVQSRRDDLSQAGRATVKLDEMPNLDRLSVTLVGRVGGSQAEIWWGTARRVKWSRVGRERPERLLILLAASTPLGSKSPRWPGEGRGPRRRRSAASQEAQAGSARPSAAHRISRHLVDDGGQRILLQPYLDVLVGVG